MQDLNQNTTFIKSLWSIVSLFGKIMFMNCNTFPTSHYTQITIAHKITLSHEFFFFKVPYTPIILIELWIWYY
jgi:hypothetical protein